MSTSNNDTDDTDDQNCSPTSSDLTGDDEIDFQLDIMDGEDPSRPVTDDECGFDAHPPGPGPMPGTMRFVRTVDDTWAFIERGNLFGWIESSETISLDDVR